MDVVEVAYARDATEAGLIQGLLENAGIASSLQRVGINGPMVGIGLLNPGGGGSRVLVMADRAEEARALLAETLVEDPGAFPEPAPSPSWRWLPGFRLAAGDLSRGERRRRVS